MPIWKALFFLSLPIVINNVLQTAYQLTDAFWVGRLGEGAIATVTLSWAIIFLSISVGSWLAIAGSILIAQYFGAKNQKEVNHTSAQTLLMVFVVAVAIAILWNIFAPQIIHLLWAKWDIFDQTVHFVRISFITLIFMFQYFMFQSIMRAVGSPNVPIFIMVISLIINFALNPILIFGHGSFWGFGVIGSAMTTLVAQAIATVIGYVIMFGGKFGIKLHLHDFIPNFETIKKSFFLWIPSSMEMLARSGSLTLMIAIVGVFGTTALAGWWAAGNIMQVFIIFGMGLSMATSILVGQSVWADDIQKAKEVNIFSAKLSFVAMLLIWIIGFVFARELITFFVPDDIPVVDIWVEAFRISAFFFGFMGVSMSFTGVLRAVGMTKIPMYTTIFSEWILKLPLAYILSHFTTLGLMWVWWANPIATVILTIVLYVLIHRIDWSKANIIKKAHPHKNVPDPEINELISETIA